MAGHGRDDELPSRCPATGARAGAGRGGVTHSVLRGLTPDRIERDPFPHVVVDDALDPVLYRELEAALPPAETLLRGRALENNTPYHYAAQHILAEAPACWREFARLHTSAAFFADVVALFGDTIR